MMITDSHFHVVSSGALRKLNGIFPASYDGAAIDQICREKGLGRVVCLSSAYFFDDEESAQLENDFVARESSKFPDSMIPYGSVKVGTEWMAREFLRCTEVLKIKGLKIHLSNNKVSLLDTEKRQSLKYLFQSAGDRSIPVLIHFNYWSTDEFIELIKLMLSFPKTKFILAHALLTNFRNLGLLAAVYVENPKLPRNIFIDISGALVFFHDSPEEETFYWYLRKLGMNRVIFGSDFPTLSIEDSLNALARSPLNKNERIAVTNGNIMEIHPSLSHRPNGSLDTSRALDL